MLYECDLSVLEHREKGVTYVFLEFCPIRTAADLKTIHKYEVQLVATPAGGDILSHELKELPSIHIRTTGDNKEKDSSLVSTSR